MGFNVFDPDDWEDLASDGWDAFNSAVDWIVGEGTSMVGTLADGTVKIYKTTSGALSYATDLTKTSATSIQNWAGSAAGLVTEYSMGAYQEAGVWIMNNWSKLAGLAAAAPPPLGPPNPVARDAMVALLGIGTYDTLVRAWENDAKRKGYTLAFNLRANFTIPALQTGTFAGIYVDKTGQWGFFASAGVGVGLYTSLNLYATIDVWMIWGGREAYGTKYLMPGINIAIPTLTGTAITAGGNVLLTPGGLAFKGFTLNCGMAAIAPEKDGLPTTQVMPSSGPPQNNVLAATLSAKSASYDAACRAQVNPSQASSILGTAGGAALPFLSAPEKAFWLQAVHSGKCLEVVDGSTADRAVIAQGTYRGGYHQMFRFFDTKLNDNSFYILPVHSIVAGKSFDITNASKSKGAYLQQYMRRASDNPFQHFRFLSNNDGTYCIIAKHSGLALDVEAVSTADGARVHQWTWHGKANQRFRIMPIV